MLRFCVVPVFLMGSLFGNNSLRIDSVDRGLASYFKKIEGKLDCHTIENIDFIYVINLDERPEKFKHTSNELGRFGITPYRFSAVNGWKLPLESLSQLGIKFGPWMSSGQMGTSYLPENKGEPSHEIVQIPGRTYFSHCMARGAIGIVLSHLSVLQDAYDSGYETIWVMEDDIEVKQDPHILSVLIAKLDELKGRDGWDVLFTDPDTKGQNGCYVPCTASAWMPNFTPPDPYKFATRADLSPDFKQVGARYGAYSMIVRRSGMKKILDFYKKYNIFLPYDMEYTLPPSIALISLRYEVVSTLPQALSDNGSPSYER